MPDRELVSVVIPFANARPFLQEAIESVCAQTYTQWELILVDDGSRDGSTRIAEDFAAASNGKIRCIEHDGRGNRGVTATRNLGARSSTGEFLAFLDADDVWLPQKLQHQVSVMLTHPEAGLVYGPSEYWYDRVGPETAIALNEVVSVAPGATLYRPPELFIRSHPFGGYGAPCPSSFLLRRSAFESVGGFVEEFSPLTYQLYEDTAFLSRVYLNLPVFVTDLCTDRYRCRTDSIWHRLKDTTGEEKERRFYFQWLRRYLRQKHIQNPRIWKVVNGAAWPYWLPLPDFATRFARRVQRRLSRPFTSSGQ